MEVIDVRLFKKCGLSSVKEIVDSHANTNDPYTYICRMPNECDPKIIPLGFMYSNGKYCVGTNNTFKYTGTDKALTELANEQVIVSPIWEDIEEAVYHFGNGSFTNYSDEPNDTNIESRASPNEEPRANSEDEEQNIAPPINVDDVTDFNSIVMPKASDTESKTVHADELYRKLKSHVMGQDKQVETLAFVASQHANKMNPKRPATILLSGPAGVGKTESAKALVDELSSLSGQKYGFVKIDLNTFSDKFSVNNLTGSAPGYIGHDEEPLFHKMTENRHTVTLFDEFDKAHPEVQKILMSAMDEGTSTSNRPLADGSNTYDFRHGVFIFTSNYDLSGKNNEPKIGFRPDKIENFKVREDNSVSAKFKNTGKDSSLKDDPLALRIYKDTEAARKEFVNIGILPEVASRFQCFINFDPLSDEAKCRILAKQIIETGLEYSIRISYIAPSIMQEIINAAMSKDSQTVRSFRGIIEGYLAPAFAKIRVDPDKTYKLEGELNSPRLRFDKR